ncbi:hypothetical protein DLAC_01314 [Tieghemostelium lacteum]|uniref:Phosphoglycerate mutase family protein n=1 Tax=Tieghemostelium lacteum TaxID=361077 RepID=A0A152A8D5_TIELA|nr:hypothetical protein DLAC_01314 [Tieghemostelium lacteum]|eukprot:KYR02474.1 hypothetical protein DLAC_01314 [Tieghemostelium lacteum]
MVILTFIRHGETDFNKNGILQGHLNIPLNQNGREESAIIGTRLSSQIQEYPVDLVISSDLDRATETASIILEHLHMVSDHLIPSIQTPLLRERYLGKLEGVDLKHLVNWREQTEQTKQMIDIQKILSQKSFSLGSLLSNLSSSSNNHSQHLNNTISTTPSTTISKDTLINNDNSNSSTTIGGNSPILSHSLSSSSSSVFSEFNSEEFTSSNPSSLSSSTSSLSSMDEIENKLTSSSISSNSTTFIQQQQQQQSITPSVNLTLTSNILKHLPQKELKIESKSKLIKRAKDAFQFILKQVPNRYITRHNPNEPTDNLTNTNNTNYNNINAAVTSHHQQNSDNFHIVIVSHNVMLRALVSLLFCKKSTTPLFCNKFSSSTNKEHHTLTQSESTSSSSRNFKWIQLEFKNNYLRTHFNVLEKKEKSKDTLKRVPRNIEMIQYSENTNINNIIDLCNNENSFVKSSATKIIFKKGIINHNSSTNHLISSSPSTPNTEVSQ